MGRLCWRIESSDSNTQLRRKIHHDFIFVMYFSLLLIESIDYISARIKWATARTAVVECTIAIAAIPVVVPAIAAIVVPVVSASASIISVIATHSFYPHILF